MKVRLEYVSFYLLIGILLPAIGLGDAFTCPDNCSCSEIQRKRYNYNHAKCTSLDGLRQLGKTSELHSLDLSSMNLTKINNQLDKLSNLSKLDLSDNHLSEISNLHQRRIRVLNISGNRITSGKLAKIPWTVKHLNLSHNDITILPEMFKRFVHLKSLELADNPLNCTCETLEIRNWLQERQVYTEKAIRCMAPLQFKGRSWLQIRQSEVCDPNGLEPPRMLPFSDGTDDENDLMLGDDPNAGFENGFEGEYLPVSANQRTKRTDATADSEEDYINDDDNNDEGSGSEPEEMVTKSDSTTEAYEGSGDDGEITSQLPNTDDDAASNETLSGENDKTSEDTTDIGPSSLNSRENTSAETLNESETLAPVTEEIIVPVKSATNDAEFIETPDGTAAATRKQPKQSDATKIENDEVHESNSTYILLAILGVLLVVLILYVATKRSRTNTKNRRNNNDIESPAQELKNMDKNNLGKPIQNPVEFIPLIPEKHDPERKTNLCNGEEPLLQKLTEVENENETTDDGKQKAAADDKQPANGNAQQLNGNAKPVQNGVHPGNDDNAANDPQFQPISPKPSRYSPVYSHDTGRVKIKLSETSRPKTPILVTRSRSNAGDNKFDNTISQ
ncbi:protein windpipe [Sitodiplosis mosellana]|uniref:protein windpipe n=1 Tax=Sitodiplosis mosellana TaxID=263140 RepID=UPI0024448A2D|nr:protein windpipe [Sitodiplosis mosellana]XP_055315960.1 protein windpipe [Sitodiplosis mosellana]XP_055315961.1 protein windpipe [Sitodiplosis mosellana]XP_055315962.1 protein windpipe [Sitodiplosis mosellana]XP_055315963.1 protein windpipe [Sitodiplosis mosellana]